MNSFDPEFLSLCWNDEPKLEFKWWLHWWHRQAESGRWCTAGLKLSGGPLACDPLQRSSGSPFLGQYCMPAGGASQVPLSQAVWWLKCWVFNKIYLLLCDYPNGLYMMLYVKPRRPSDPQPSQGNHDPTPMWWGYYVPSHGPALATLFPASCPGSMGVSGGSCPEA